MCIRDASEREGACAIICTKGRNKPSVVSSCVVERLVVIVHFTVQFTCTKTSTSDLKTNVCRTDAQSNISLSLSLSLVSNSNFSVTFACNICMYASLWEQRTVTIQLTDVADPSSHSFNCMTNSSSHVSESMVGEVKTANITCHTNWYIIYGQIVKKLIN